MLYDYKLELMRTHLGSTIKFRCDARVFQAMYVCLTPLREGFLVGCKQIISLDGCFPRICIGDSCCQQWGKMQMAASTPLHGLL